MSGSVGRLERACASPRMPVAAAAVAVALCLPALWVGWQADDWTQQAIIQQTPPPNLPPRAPLLGMFSFMLGDPADNAALRDAGILPWYAPDHLRANFLRPVTVLTHLLDDTVARGDPRVAHAHSLLWLAFTVLLAAALFRRVHGPGVIAGLAALLFAVDEAHGIPAGWIANRNALVAGAFGLMALLAHLRARTDGDLRFALASPVLMLLGLLAGEAAIATAAWLGAWALCLDPAGRRRGLLHLTPHVVVVLAWRVVYGALGYGASGSGLYIDPVRTPLRFAGAALMRVPVLLADIWYSFPSLVSSFVPTPIMALIAAVSAAGVLGLAWLARHLLRESPTARFWALGMVLSLVPVAATFPADRLLVFAGIGFAGLLAQWLRTAGVAVGHAPGDAPPSDAPRLPRLVLGAVAVLHLVVAPVMLPMKAYAMVPLTDLLFDGCEAVSPRGPDAPGRTVVVVNSNELCAIYVPFRRAVTGVPAPRAVRLLASALYDIDLVGVDPHTVELRVPAGYQSNVADRLVRDRDEPMPVGATVQLPGLHAEVISHNADGLVDGARFRFDVPLRDPSLVWIRTLDAAPAPMVPPAPGETLHLAGAAPW